MTGTAPRRWGRVVFAIATVAYPLLVWFGMSRWSPRVLALVMLAALLPLSYLRLRDVPRDKLVSVAIVPAITGLALLLAAWLDARGYVLIVPAVINAALLVGFGSTLRRGSMPMIERFARLQTDDLPDEALAWCRGWTQVWCGFFVLNGATVLVLARWAPVSWWALYTGLLSYVLIGLLMATEWLLRRRKLGVGGGAER